MRYVLKAQTLYQVRIEMQFMKAELETIHNWGDVYCEFGQSWTYGAEKPLIDKIQSMIDNYCEHEPSDKYPNEFKWQLCAKCRQDYK